MLEVAKKVADSTMLPLNIVENYIAKEERMKMDQQAYLSDAFSIDYTGSTDILVPLLLPPP